MSADPLQHAAAERRPWQLFLPYLRPHRTGLLLHAAAAALLSLSVLPVLWLVRLVFDRAIPQLDIGLLFIVGAGIVLIRLAVIGVSLFLRRRVVHMIKSAVLGLREDLLSRIYANTREGLSRNEIDRLQNRIVQESERIDVVCNGALSNVLPAVFSSLALFTVLLIYSPLLVLLVALVVPALWGAARLTNRGVRRDVAHFQAAFEAFNKGVSFVLRQIDLTRAQGVEREELARQKAHLRRLTEDGEQMSWSFAVHGQMQSAVTGVAGIVLLVFGGLQVAQGRLTIGELLAFYFGATLLNGAMSTVSRGSADIVSAGLSMDKLGALLEPDPRAVYTGSGLIDFDGGVELEGVSFGYPEAPVLQGLDLKIAPGERVAIIGANGSGKTTLLQMLLGLVRPHAGMVRSGGHAYETLDTSALRRQIGVVMQQSGFFFGTVRSNLCYGNPDVPEDKVIAAAKLAGAHDFITALPLGYETIVGDSGTTLSGGECQRIAIARALLRSPRALIFDEPTNHLDVQAVAELMQALARLKDSPTIILVSHDTRVLDLVHRTYELRDGRLARVPPPAAEPAPAPVALQIAA